MAQQAVFLMVSKCHATHMPDQWSRVQVPGVTARLLLDCQMPELLAVLHLPEPLVSKEFCRHRAVIPNYYFTGGIPTDPFDLLGRGSREAKCAGGGVFHGSPGATDIGDGYAPPLCTASVRVRRFGGLTTIRRWKSGRIVPQVMPK
jgi:hypothetical protein